MHDWVDSMLEVTLIRTDVPEKWIIDGSARRQATVELNSLPGAERIFVGA